MNQQEITVKILSSVEKQNKSILVFAGFILIGIIGFVDYFTGYEFAFSVFYVFPIYLITWVTNQRSGFVASIASAIAWLIADITTGHPYSHPLNPIWNTLIRLPDHRARHRHAAGGRSRRP